jgi:hypothetical protein
MNMPTKYFALVLIPAIFCLVAVQSVPASEPAYGGKPLSEWLLVLEEPHIVSGEPVEAPVAEEAVRQIGTNGIPTLIDLLSVYDERSAKRVLSKLHNKDLTAWFKYDENIDSSCKNLRKLGLRGFSILGTNAEYAVPQITNVLAFSDEWARALLAVGPKGFSALTNALNSPNAGIRDIVIRALGKEGGGDPEVIKQLLVNALKDQDFSVRLDAADSLQGKEPDLVIPALIPLLSDNNYRWRAANLLAVYGSAAKSAAPQLFSIFTNQPDMMLLPALRQIDPDTATEAEAFLVSSGPLNGARFGYTTTLLPNGKELIAGGWLKVESATKNHFLSSAELLDPKTGKWTETGEMHNARWDHTAILLHNGQVLVVGGSTAKESDSTSAELYDLTTGKWTETSSMNHTHRGRDAVLESNGTVRMPGGWDGRKITDDEVYDPATEKWSTVPKK